MLRKKRWLEYVFPFLSIRHFKSLTWFQRVRSTLDTFVFICVVLWLTSFGYLKANETIVETDYIRWHINGNNVQKDRIMQLSKKIIKYLKNNPLYTTNIDFDLYIVNNDLLYTLLNPLDILSSRQSFAVTLFGKFLIVRDADLDRNIVRTSAKTEKLDAVVAHEMVHRLQFHKYGFLKSLIWTPKWVTEGYATYATRDLYLAQDAPKRLLSMYKHKDVNFTHSPHIAYSYELYALMIKYAIEKMGYSIDDLHLGKVKYSKILKALYCQYRL